MGPLVRDASREDFGFGDATSKTPSAHPRLSPPIHKGVLLKGRRVWWPQVQTWGLDCRGLNWSATLLEFSLTPLGPDFLAWLW
jgi:hypothetical protein